MYKIYEFYREPGDNDSVRLVAEIANTDMAYKHMLELFTTSNSYTRKYYCFADNVFNADIIRINLWHHINVHEKVAGYVLYTVYAFNKTSKTLKVYPMHVFTDYDTAVEEALNFGSVYADWIFVVATSRNQALKECAYYHANQAHAKELTNKNEDAAKELDVFEQLRNKTDTATIYKPLKNTENGILQTEEKCYYSDGMLYMREIREYYDIGDTDEEEEED